MSLLYKKRNDGKLQTWDVEVEGGKYRTITGTEGGKTITSEWTACVGKNPGKANATSDAEQAQKEAAAMVAKKIKSGYRDNVAALADVDNFEVMCAHKYTKYKDKVVFPAMVQRKYNGIRCTFRWQKDRVVAISRLHNEFVSIPHLTEAYTPLLQKRPDIVVDGELYSHDFYNDFPEIVSIIKTRNVTQEDLDLSAKLIRHFVYDVKFKENPELSYVTRMQMLQQNPDFIANRFKVDVPTEFVNSHEEFMAKHDQYTHEGYEGIMYRANTPYEHKRTVNLLKYKVFTDEEFEIVDVLAGEGNRTGRAGSVVCRMPDGRTCNANIKGSFEYCRKLLENKQSVIGKMATVQYFVKTPAGIPYLPHMIAVRDYE